MKRTILILFSVLALVVVGCTSDGDTSDGVAPEAGGTEDVQTDDAATDADGDDEADTSDAGEKVLTLGFYANINSLDPATACSNEDGRITLQLYDRLVRHGTVTLDDGTVAIDYSTIEPRLAEDWELSDDGTVYTFHLKDGVTFPSGADVDAEAVVYSFERNLTMNQCGVYILTAGLPDNFVSVEAIDRLTVQFTLEQPDPVFMSSMTAQGAGIVDKTVVDQHGGVVAGEANEWMNSNSAGSGPYLLERLEPSDEIVLVANPDYHEGKPHFDRVIYKIIQEPANRILLLERGDLDFVFNIPYRELDRLKANPDLQVVQQPGLNVTFVGLNHSMEPFNNPLVREALAHAVPYTEIIESVTYGHTAPMRSLIPPPMAHHNPEFFTPTTDLDRARELLAEAGFPDGFSFTLDIQSGIQEFDDVAVILQQQFAEIGVTMDIRRSDLATYYEYVRPLQSEAYLIARTTGVNDPGYFLGYMLPCDSPFQYSAYCNERVDELLREARHEHDADVRQELYDEIQQLHAADYPDLWLYVKTEAFPMQGSLRGFVYDPTLKEEFYRLYEED